MRVLMGSRALSAMPVRNALHYLRMMESVTLHLHFISKQIAFILSSYLTCFERVLVAGIW